MAEVIRQRQAKVTPARQGNNMHSWVHSTYLLLSLFTLLITQFAFADDSDESYYNQFSVCADSKIIIEEISLYCDSPGSYYYGSSKYRNSATCQASDKAKLQIIFYIVPDNEGNDDGNDNKNGKSSSNVVIQSDPFMTIEVQGYGTVGDVSVLDAGSSFCESVTAIAYNNVASSSSVSCPPAAGYYYQFKQQFYWGDQNDSYEYSFVPKVTVGISSNVETNYYYDLGGANTNKCYSGNTFSSWTIGVRKSAANTFITFFISFGILLFTISSITLFTYCIMKHHMKRYGAVSRTKPPIVNESIVVDEVIDQPIKSLSDDGDDENNNDYHIVDYDQPQHSRQWGLV